MKAKKLLHRTTIEHRNYLQAAIGRVLKSHGLFGKTVVDQFDFGRTLFRDRDVCDLDLHRPISLTPGIYRFRSRAAEARVEVGVTDSLIEMRRLTITDRANHKLLDQMLALLFATGASNGDATATPS